MRKFMPSSERFCLDIEHHCYRYDSQSDIGLKLSGWSCHPSEVLWSNKPDDVIEHSEEIGDQYHKEQRYDIHFNSMLSCFSENALKKVPYSFKYYLKDLRECALLSIDSKESKKKE